MCKDKKIRKPFFPALDNRVIIHMSEGEIVKVYSDLDAEIMILCADEDNCALQSPEIGHLYEIGEFLKGAIH